MVFFIAVQRQLWGPTSHRLNVHRGSTTGNAPVAQRSTDSRVPGVLNGEPRKVEVPPKPPCATISVLSVSICWGSAPGTPGSSLGLPCQLPQAFLRDSHLPTHNAHLSSAHGSTHHIPPWTIPSPPPDQRTAPHLCLFSHVPGPPFPSFHAWFRTVHQLLGSPGGLNLPSLWFTLSCSANTLKWFYVTWSISPMAGCLLEKGPSNCGWHLLKQTGLRYRAGDRAPNRTLLPLLCQFFRAPQCTWRPRMCPCRDLCGTCGQPQLWSIFLGHSCLPAASQVMLMGVGWFRLLVLGSGCTLESGYL